MTEILKLLNSCPVFLDHLTINVRFNDEKQNFVDNRIPEIENYNQDEIDAQIEGYNIQNTMEDVGDYDCLCEDDLFQNTWLIAGKKFQNHIDYFWDAEITDLFQNEKRDFYTKYRDDFSEDTWENYSKYRCLEGESGFVFCMKENCEGCNHVNTKKVINPHYRLWEKYVEPLILA